MPGWVPLLNVDDVEANVRFCEQVLGATLDHHKEPALRDPDGHPIRISSTT